jgi:polyamine oxidase
MCSVATYDHTGFIDYLDVFNSAVDNYTSLTVAAGKFVSS